MSRTLTVFYYGDGRISRFSFEQSLYSLICLRGFHSLEIILLGKQADFPPEYPAIIEKLMQPGWERPIQVRQDLIDRDGTGDVFSALNDALQKTRGDFI